MRVEEDDSIKEADEKGADSKEKELPDGDAGKKAGARDASANVLPQVPVVPRLIDEATKGLHLPLSDTTTAAPCRGEDATSSEESMAGEAPLPVCARKADRHTVPKERQQREQHGCSPPRQPSIVRRE